MVVWISAIAVSRWRMPEITPVSVTSSPGRAAALAAGHEVGRDVRRDPADQPRDEEEADDDDQDRERPPEPEVMLELIDDAVHRSRTITPPAATIDSLSVSIDVPLGKNGKARDAVYLGPGCTGRIAEGEARQSQSPDAARPTRGLRAPPRRRSAP